MPRYAQDNTDYVTKSFRFAYFAVLNCSVRLHETDRIFGLI